MGGAVDGGQTKRGCGEWKLVEVVRGAEPSQGHVASGAVRGCRGDHEGRGRWLGLLWPRPCKAPEWGGAGGAPEGRRSGLGNNLA